MKKSNLILNILIAASAIGCIGFALYPTFANLINQMDQNENIVVYNKVVQSVDTSELDKMWNDAKAFNKELASSGHFLSYSEKQSEEYGSVLNPAGDGLIGYVDVPDQDIHLSIYHGTDDEVLDTAVGHLEGTSFPTDGESVFSIITGHTGLVNLDLFTDIHNMAEGDTFTVTSLNRILTYAVDDISVVLPEEMYNLSIVKGENYCTLVTCTPYGVNDHRLLVRGRLTNVETTGTSEETQTSYAYAKNNAAQTTLIQYFGIAIIAATTLFVIALIIKWYKDNH